MYPQHLSGLLKRWLLDAEHPGVSDVRTCAEIGRHEQPVGVVVTLSDGWRMVWQAVGSYPPGGAANENPDTPKPEKFDGMWDQLPEYKAARKADEAAAKAYTGPRSRKPAATADAIVALIVDVVKRADHAEIAHVETVRRSPDQPETVRIACDDKAMIYGLVAGFMPPGATSFSHPDHQIPKEFQNVPSVRSVDQQRSR